MYNRVHLVDVNVFIVNIILVKKIAYQFESDFCVSSFSYVFLVKPLIFITIFL